jgi:UDP-galactopyranose mutase
MSKQYDYLIVGAGLFGAVCARELTDAGRSCLVIDKRDHIAGNAYTEEVDGVCVHVYGPHIFHTSMPHVWEYVNRFATFNNFILNPIANYKGELYNLPFNMNTFYQMWGVRTPAEAKAMIAGQRSAPEDDNGPANLEEQAISLVGRDIYEKLIKGYTEKQWGRPCTELPPSIIKRLPVRFRYDNNYFNDPYQGIPTHGYTDMVSRILDGIDIELGADYLAERPRFESAAAKVIYTGPIDQYFDYCFGELEWRSLRFETETAYTDNYQGVAVMNFTDRATPYTRIIEHKHFAFGDQPATVLTKEYPAEWSRDRDAYYPVNDDRNAALYEHYKKLAASEWQVSFGGRLGSYRYYDMDAVVDAALKLARDEAT